MNANDQAKNACAQDNWDQGYDVRTSYQQILLQIAEDMQRLGISDIRVIQDGLSVRPFFVAAGIWEGQRVIYKAMTRKIPFQVSILHEGIFLADIAPVLMEKRLPARLRNKIFVPKIFALALDNPIPAIVEEYFEGELLGICDMVDTTMLSEQDLHDFVDFITISRGLTKEDILALAPQSAGQLKFGKPDEENVDFISRSCNIHYC